MFIFGGQPLLWAEPMRRTDCNPSSSKIILLPYINAPHGNKLLLYVDEASVDCL